jgi:hypothetical protein
MVRRPEANRVPHTSRSTWPKVGRVKTSAKDYDLLLFDTQNEQTTPQNGQSRVNYRHEARCEQHRFRKDPEHYLRALEEQLSQ